jgi:hypothetical protein
MTSRKFGHFFEAPSLHRHVFYYWGLSTVVTTSLTPSPIYGWPLIYFSKQLFLITCFRLLAEFHSLPFSLGEFHLRQKRRTPPLPQGCDEVEVPGDNESPSRSLLAKIPCPRCPNEVVINSILQSSADISRQIMWRKYGDFDLHKIFS